MIINRPLNKKRRGIKPGTNQKKNKKKTRQQTREGIKPGTKIKTRQQTRERGKKSNLLLENVAQKKRLRPRLSPVIFFFFFLFFFFFPFFSWLCFHAARIRSMSDGACRWAFVCSVVSMVPISVCGGKTGDRSRRFIYEGDNKKNQITAGRKFDGEL